MPSRVDLNTREQIKKQYIEGIVKEGVHYNPSMSELAQKYNTTVQTISRWSKLENWILLKHEYKKTIEKKAMTKKTSKIAETIARFDEKCLSIAEGMINEVGRKLQASQTLQKINQNSQGLPHSEIKDLSVTALNAQKLGRLALGEASEINKTSVDIEADDAFRRNMQRLLDLRESRADNYSVH